MSIHNAKIVTMIIEPIAAISATNDIIISSQESQVKHNNNKASGTNASTIFFPRKYFVPTPTARVETTKAREGAAGDGNE